MANILGNHEILKDEVRESLYPYQIDELCSKARAYLELNRQSNK